MRTLRRLAFLPLLPFLLLMVMAIPGEHSLLATAAATKNCSDFNSQAEAQSYFDKLGGSKTNNVDSLDADHDGIACEDLKHSGTVAKTVDAATGGGIGTGIAIGVVICLAVLIFWLYKRRPTSGVAFSTGTGLYSPSRLNTSSRPTVDSSSTEMPASLSSSMDAISTKDDPYSPENLGAVTNSPETPAPVEAATPPAQDVSIGSPGEQPAEKAPPPVRVAASGMLALTVKTADGAAIPASAKLSIGAESRYVAASAGSPTSDITLELPVGSLSHTITGTAPYLDIQDKVEIVSNAVVRVAVTLAVAPST